MGQNDTIGKIELIPSSVLSEDNTNCCNDIHKFSNSLSYQESTEIQFTLQGVRREQTTE